MPPRSPFRMLAPVALAVAVLAVFLLASPSSEEAAAPPAPVATTTTAEEPSRRTHVVRRGENLSTIARRFGVDVDRLTELNPRADPQALQTGQRLRLRD